MRSIDMSSPFPRLVLLLAGSLAIFMVFTLAIVLVVGAASPEPQLSTDEATPCVNGFAGTFPCERVDLLAFMSLSDLGGGVDTKGANLWGWTDSLDGTEYVLMGLTDATAFVDISDPENPVLLGQLPTHTISSNYRDMKVYGDYAFIIADTPSLHGMQVFDLTQLRDAITPTVTFTETAYYSGFGNAHNIFINQDTGYAYVVRNTAPDLCSGALNMIDIQNPTNPTDAGCFEQGGIASDSICVVYHGPDLDYQSREVCVVASDDDIVLADVTDKDNPVHLATRTYPSVVRAHNAWFTEDHHYFVSADMNDEMDFGLNTRIFIWDVADLESPVLLDYYEAPTTASDHNVWVNGLYAYVGNFHAGLRILDLSRISSGILSEAAYFDLFPQDDAPSHHGGAWAAYPFFQSGVVAVSDKELGLYLLQPNLPQPQVWLPFLGSQAP